jgi:uncharacterized protein YbaR (Trm112 family)
MPRQEQIRPRAGALAPYSLPLPMLVCPATGLAVARVSRREAEDAIGAPLVSLRLPAKAFVAPIGATETVLLREDRNAAYPVVEEIPVLLAPEMLVAPSQQRDVDLTDPRYAEAYAEMAFYNRIASEASERITESGGYRHVCRVLDHPTARATFPEPRAVWLDAPYDAAAQWDVYAHMAPLEGKRMLQLGGKGIGLVKFLLGGLREGWLLTPMLGEARFATALATVAGVQDRLRLVIAVGEELPFADETFDRIYSGGCLHHMNTAVALAEAARILSEDGRFGANDPWRTPLYAVGTRVLGQREAKLIGSRDHGVFCRPLTSERMRPLPQTFRQSTVIQHGALTRYFLIALSKFGVHTRLSVAWLLNRVDDAIASLVPGLRRWGSSAAVLGQK